MRAPYLQDLHDRVIAAYDRGMKTKHIAEVLAIIRALGTMRQATRVRRDKASPDGRAGRDEDQSSVPRRARREACSGDFSTITHGTGRSAQTRTEPALECLTPEIRPRKYRPRLSQ